MPQIKKKNRTTLALAGILSTGAVGLMNNAESVSADTVTPTNQSNSATNSSANSASSTSSSAASNSVVSATTSGAGSDVIQGNSSNTPNQSVVNLINSQIRNLQTSSNGMVTVDSTPKILTTQDVTNVQASITKLADLINQYNSLNAQLQSQNQTTSSINGMTGNDNTTHVTGSTIDQTATNLQSLVDQMQTAVNKNNQLLKDETQQHAQNTALAQIVKNDNQIISNAAATTNNGKSGIIGDLDTINRKSQDSVNQNGIVVDNSKTQQMNAVQSKQTTNTQYTNVTSTQQAADELTRILNNIQSQTAANAQQASKADTYKTNAVNNIDDLNSWLAKEQASAKAAKDASAAATTSITHMSDYKTQTLAKLNQAMALLKSKNASQRMIDNLQQAIDTVNASTLTQTALPAVGQKDPYDFGDIGQDQNTQNGSQDGTIANTKTTEDTNLQNAIKNGVAQVQASNSDVESRITPVINKNESAVDKYLDAISKGGTGSQIDDTYLNGMSIYTKNNDSGTRDFYAQYIKAALAQTESSISSIQDQLNNSNKVVPITGNPTIASLSAAMYAQNAGTMGDGFGSVMLKSSNVNDDISDYTVDSGSKVLADSRSDGGTQAVYDALVHLPGYANIPGGYSNLAVVKDMKEQYIDRVGANNVFTIVTDSPDLVVTLPNSFVYNDANGKTGSATMKVAVSATAYDGSSIARDLQKNSATASGTYALFVYTFAVDPYTGQLVAGVGYIAGQNPFNGTGTNVPDVSGGGEAINMQSFIPMDQGAAEGIGLAQSIAARVDPTNTDAVKYANYSPVFVSDIDDGQELLAYTTSSNKSKIVTDAGQSQIGNLTNWNNPYGQTGTAYGMVANNKDSTDATDNKTTIIDGQSAAVYNLEGSGGGLNGMRVTLRSKGTGSNNTYMSIDTALFAPFGIVGTPQIKMDAVNDDVKTLEVNDVKAKAHTDGTYTLTSSKEYLTSGNLNPAMPQNISGDLVLPSYLPSQTDSKQVASNTAMVVTKQKDIQNLVASGNSMTVVAKGNNNKTSSGNSMAIHTNSKTQTTGSSNSLVVRTTTTKSDTASGQSFVVRISKGIANINNNGTTPVINPLPDAQLAKVAPVITKNSDGTSTAAISVYVDPTIMSTAQAALADWKTALAQQGIDLEVTFTSSTDELKKGVSLAILDADSDDTQVGSSDSSKNSMNGLGGLTTDTVNSLLTDPTAKFNASGTVTAGDVLKNSMTAIQLNSQALKDESFKDTLLKGQLTKDVLKHELGHFLGLHHDIKDSLMTTSVTNVAFTGEISETDAKLAAANLLKGINAYTVSEE